MLENASRNPRPPTVGRMRESRLAKIGRHTIELPPTDAHFVSICRIDANGWLICSVANNVIATHINVDLIARVRPETRDQARRSGVGLREPGWASITFERTPWEVPGCR